MSRPRIKTRVRGALYVAIAALGFALGEFRDDMTAGDWVRFTLGLLLAVANTLRAFIDRTPLEEKQEHEREALETEPGLPNGGVFASWENHGSYSGARPPPDAAGGAL